MTYKTYFLEKQELKKLAQAIREGRVVFRDCQRGNSDKHTDKELELSSDLDQNRWTYRHRHIAYCEARGKSREVIEKPNEDNLPDEALIEEFKTELLEALTRENSDEEDVCAGAEGSV